MGEIAERKVSVAQDSEMLRIYIGDLPHCIVKKKEFVGFVSYKDGGVYYVEVWLKSRRELLIHETIELWEKILKALDEAL